MTRVPPPLSFDTCLFLDVDGTLVEFTDTPSQTVADPEIKSLLAAIASRLKGAVALVSGREIRTLDALFSPLKLPASGLHGVERRNAKGRIYGGDVTDHGLNAARGALSQLTRSYPGTLVEDKGRNVAVHFRLAPQFADAVRRTVFAIAAPLRDHYQLQEGTMTLEMMPKGFSKGSAVQAFMQESPFTGRRPVFIGDDLTDMDGFAAVEADGGMSIGVGPRVTGQYHLNNVAEVRRYLQGLAALDGQ
jgi:trehalose 6-phosphate phosphatase